MLWVMVAAPPRTQPDLKPELVSYRDEGCTYHPSCLTCPFETCRFDDADGNAFQANLRRQKVAELLGGGMAVDAVARVLGISKSTVARVKRRIQEARD
jgi:transposase-like protein